jgi:Ca-activated chloride channel family protein
MSGELQLKATLHRPVYQSMPAPQQVYVLLEAIPVSFASKGVHQPVNLCLALDRSGSMAGEKLRHLKDAARQIVDRLGGEDLLSIVVFDDQDPAEVILPAGRVQDKELIKQKIDAIQERGGTHLSTGLRLALRELQQGSNPTLVSSLVLLTDGRTWEDESDCRELADQCGSAGIPLYLFGLGVGEDSNWDPRLLEDLAQRSGGEWMVIEKPEQVCAAFEKTLMALQGVAVTNARLTMRLVQGATPRSVWRVTPLISRLGHQAVALHDIQIFLGDIQQRSGQAILADLLVPSRPAGVYRLFQADATYDVPCIGLSSQRAEVEAVINFTEEASQANQVDGRLMNIIERVLAHRLQTQALDEAVAGDAARATQRLRAAATRLLELGELEMAQQAEQQAARIERGGHIDLAVAQKMRFATKRLTEIEP